MFTHNQIQNRNVVERTLLAAMYPNLNPKQRRILFNLLREKNIELFNLEECYNKADDVLCSIIRHKDTNYDQLIQHTEKYKARAILGHIVSEKLKLAKGGKVDVYLVHAILETGTPVKVVSEATPNPEQKRCEVIGHVPNLPPVNVKVKTFPKVMLNSPGFVDLTGAKFGDFMVIGSEGNVPLRWLCQCKCGQVEPRKTKAVKNPANADDKCIACRQSEFQAKRRK